jgi:hypothetical protein
MDEVGPNHDCGGRRDTGERGAAQGTTQGAVGRNRPTRGNRNVAHWLCEHRQESRARENQPARRQANLIRQHRAANAERRQNQQAAGQRYNPSNGTLPGSTLRCRENNGQAWSINGNDSAAIRRRSVAKGSQRPLTIRPRQVPRSWLFNAQVFLEPQISLAYIAVRV